MSRQGSWSKQRRSSSASSVRRETQGATGRGRKRGGYSRQPPRFRDKTRIPVLAGDRLGLYGPQSEGTLACNTGEPEDELGFLHGAASLGTTLAFASLAGFRVPVSASLEPDLDGDGYGDETQDGCPESAEYQTACPYMRLDIAEFRVKRHSIVLHVTASSEGRSTSSGRSAGPSSNPGDPSPIGLGRLG